MGIKIYRYEDPYKLRGEPFWDEISSNPHFCVSQTLVNGMKLIYGTMKLSTVNYLINKLYCDWESRNTKVKQIMEVDSALGRLAAMGEMSLSRRNSFAHNEKSVAECIRMFMELDTDPDSFDLSALNVDQRHLVNIYKLICRNERSSFRFVRDCSPVHTDKAVAAALAYDKTDNTERFEGIRSPAVVIHGVHQFTPAILCAIEDISMSRDVILLYNYQEKYKTVYSTWTNVYSCFDGIADSFMGSGMFTDIPEDTKSSGHYYPARVLADSLGRLADGDFVFRTDVLSNIRITEFDNVTEFAGYCAGLFETAKKRCRENGGMAKSVLRYMPEQLYSASGSVNDILRSYYPEQFGERHFLDYPIGHFFVSLTDMWDEEKHRAAADSLSVIKDCLSAGIIYEKRHGQLISTFNQAETYIGDERTLTGIIERLKRLAGFRSANMRDYRRIGYMNIPRDELRELIHALEDLNSIIIGFFGDFGEGGDNLNRFYSRVRDFIAGRFRAGAEPDGGIREIVEELSARLSSIDLPDTGTFICLKNTLSFYLNSDDSEGGSANWIVREFDQIDGDVLISRWHNPGNTFYHFCCLSDKDVCASVNDRMPWPLDIAFFDSQLDMMDDFKYRVFHRSRTEYGNFKRYALIYGLEFNMVGVKLSYVRSEDRAENQVYHLLKMLGIKTEKYNSDVGDVCRWKEYYGPDRSRNRIGFSETDQIRYLICPYKFVQETLIQEKTVFRSGFLIDNYMRVLLENRLCGMDGLRDMSDEEIKELISAEYDNIDSELDISHECDRLYGITKVFSNYSKYRDGYNSPDRKQVFALNKELLNVYRNIKIRKKGSRAEEMRLSDAIAADKHLENDLNKLLDPDRRDYPRYIDINYTNYSSYCKYCSCKDICLRS